MSDKDANNYELIIVPCLSTQRSQCTKTCSTNHCPARNSRHNTDWDDSHHCWSARCLSYLAINSGHVHA